MASTLPPLAQATSGALASVMSNLLVYPLDTVTTRMQTSKGRSNLVSAFKRMVREEGISSFYKGLGSDTLSTAISQFVFFYAYSLLHKGFLRHKTRTAARATVGDKASPPILSALEGLLVGCLAGLVAKGIVAPLSNVTVRQQTSSSAKAKAEDAEKKAGAAGEEDSDDEDGDYSSAPGITEIVRDILKEQGWTGLWSGYKSAIVLTTNPAITFYTFDLLKRLFIPAKHREHPSAIQTFLSGAIASSIASAITYPLILSKTRLQFKAPSGRRLYRSNVDVFRKTIKKRGIAGMYAGLEGQLVKGFVSEGVKLTIKDRFELVIVLLHRTLVQQRGAI